MNKVIDCDNCDVILQYFDESEVEKVKERYLSIGKWESVTIDSDGDVLLFKEFYF